MIKVNSKLFIASVFIAGIVFGVLGAKVIYSQKDLIFKVRGKLEERRVARIARKEKKLMLNDFENTKDLMFWKNSSAQMQLSGEHYASGSKSARVVFHPAKGASGIVMKQFFDKNKAFRNWEGYDSLSVDVFNPQNEEVKVKLKIKDQRGKSYQEILYFRPQGMTKVFISIAQLRSKIKPSQIGQMNIFFWNLNKEQILYIDNLCLVPDKFLGGSELLILDKTNIPEKGEEVYKAGDRLDFTLKKSRWLKGGHVRVPLFVNNPAQAARARFPVSGGIPFARGELQSTESLRVTDKQGQQIPAQFRILGFWSDKTIKWLGVDTVLDLVESRRQFGFLEYGVEQKNVRAQETSLVVTESKNEVMVNTGPLKLTVSKKGFRIFDQVWLDGNGDGKFSKDELVSEGSDMVIVHDGVEFRSSLDKKYVLTIEEQGPIKTTIKAQGWFVSKNKNQFCKFIVRIQAFSGERFVKVFHTFIYTGYPENKHHYLYKGKRLPKNETIEAIYLETPLRMKGDVSLALGGDGARLMIPMPHKNNTIQIMQKSSEEFMVSSPGALLIKGKRLNGWFDVSSLRYGMTVVMKDLWQQFPKGWQFPEKDQTVITSIWPRAAKALDFKTTAAADGEDAVARGSAFGLGKTHEMAFYFHEGSFSQRQMHTARLLGKTLLLSASPKWVSDTAVLGGVKAYNVKDALTEKIMERMFDWAARQVEDYKWYGMIDYGDTLSWYRTIGAKSGWHPDGRYGWMNNEAMGLHSGALMQYLRTGTYKYFQLGEAAVRHSMDVDTVHYNTVANTKKLRKKIPDDYSQVGSQHRHNADHWGGRNEETSHTNLHGILLYYYMTGYQRAFDVATEIGEFFLKERITYYKHPDIAPQRNLANVLWGTIEMYEATGDARYKKAADKWADILFKGQKYNGTWLDTYNPMARRWTGKHHVLYTMNYTLPALIAYHRSTGNKAIAQSIVKATKYYMKHPPYNPFFEALAYSYYLTGDQEFKIKAQQRLKYYASHQKNNKNPIENGMIYQKAYYIRPIEFLYQIPFN